MLAAGADVERVAVGDRVLGCFHTACAYLRAPACAATTTAASAGGSSATAPSSATFRAPRPSYWWCRGPNLTLRRVPEGMSDEVALFAGDVMGTGYHSVEHAGIRAGDTVAVLGLGPVGPLRRPGGAGRRAPPGSSRSTRWRRGWRWRPSSAPSRVHLTEEDPKRAVRAATEGRGVDVVVDAVGDPGPLAMAISLARDAGTVSGIGAYAGKGEVPLGLAWLKGLTLRLGLANVIAHVDRVLALIEAGKLDPAPLVTHQMKLDEAAEAYALYDKREALKIVLTPYPPTLSRRAYAARAGCGGAGTSLRPIGSRGAPSAGRGRLPCRRGRCRRPVGPPPGGRPGRRARRR